MSEEATLEDLWMKMASVSNVGRLKIESIKILSVEMRRSRKNGARSFIYRG